MSKDLALTLAQRVQRIKPSPTLAIGALAEELILSGKSILNMSIGEPDFDTPEHIKEAAIKAMRDHHTKYTAVEGILALRQAIALKFNEELKLIYHPGQILVSCGAKQSLYNIFMAILNPGDEVIIPAPYWVSYPDIVKLSDGEPVIVKTEFSQHFKMNAAQLKAAINDKTRAIILNSPSNPTGIAYTQAELKELGEVLLQHPSILIISDDIYEYNLWAHPFANILMACPSLYDRTVLVNGVSKTYAMTGFRIGYAAGPEKIISAMKKIQSQSTSNPTSISQYATLAALTGDQSCVAAMTNAYHERHDLLLTGLLKIPGFKCLPSDGTFYSFPCVEGFFSAESGINNDVDFANLLLTQANIAVVPGSAFGAPNFIRLSFATSKDTIKKALKQLKSLCETLKV